MSPSQETVEQTKQQIRNLINEIAELSRTDHSAEEYFPAILKRIVDALAAVGGAVWLLDPEGQLRLSYQIKVNQDLLETGNEDAMRHAKLLSRLFARGQSELIPPHSMIGEDQSEGNPTQFLLVVSPLSNGKKNAGLIEIFQRPDSAPNIQKGYLRFLEQMAGLIGDWLKGATLRQVSDRQEMWQQADHFARLVHDNLDLRDTAFTIANEGRQLIGCDRVSVAIKKGGRCKVHAISGQDSIENRSNIVLALNNLATRVVSAGESLWYDGSVEDLPPQLEEAIEDYVDLSHGRTIAVLPIRRPEKVIEGDVYSKEKVQREDLSAREIIGALIVEQIESQVPNEVMRSRVDLVYEHTARALNNSMSHSELFGMPVLRALTRATWLFRGSAFPKTMTVLALVGAVLLAMLLIRINMDLEANGSLQPVIQHQVFAHVDGEVKDVLVDHGEEVKAGQLLVTLQNRDLEIELTSLKGQRDETIESITTLEYQARLTPTTNEQKLERIRASGQLSEALKRKETLEAQIALQEQNQQRLNVVSPIDGVVMTWDLKKNLRARPVMKGNVLVTIADPRGDFEVELLMPEKRMKYLDAAMNESTTGTLDVEYKMKTDPSKTHKGVLTKAAIHGRAELDQTEGAIVKLRVKPDSMEGVSRRPGAQLVADVTAGRANAAFVWFHEVIEWIQVNVLF
ncbi:MAG: biotin/lipoyl-binding protein [Pirellulaceae bacterium]|nr:biotin/lipoyl-binding protein [Pirellulaceae bacterium]